MNENKKDNGFLEGIGYTLAVYVIAVISFVVVYKIRGL